MQLHFPPELPVSQRRDDIAAAIRDHQVVIVAGETGSGKTTTLNVISSYLPEDERIVTIEDAAELHLHQDHVLRLESRPANIEGRGTISIRDLVRNALRMRPDRIVVGEVRVRPEGNQGLGRCMTPEIMMRPSVPSPGRTKVASGCWAGARNG